MFLGAGLTVRRKSLASQGLSERDDCRRMATNTYRLQSTFLRIKPEIDRAQDEFLSVFQDELDSLLNESNQANERLRTGRLVLRQQLHSQQLEQKQYAALLNLCKRKPNSVNANITVCSSTLTMS